MQFEKLRGVHVRRLSVGASKQAKLCGEQVQAPAEKGTNSLRLLESMHGVTAASTRDLMDSYFVINSDTGCALFKSRVVEASLNPSWCDLSHSLHLIRCARNCTLELWLRRSNRISSSSEHSFSMAFSRTLDSKSLTFVASNLGSLYRPFQENTLLLEFEDGLYQLEAAAIADAGLSSEQPQSDESKTPKESFDLKFCEMFMGMQEELSKVRESIGTMLKESDHLIAKCDAISDENVKYSTLTASIHCLLAVFRTHFLIIFDVVSQIARSRRSSYLRNELRIGARLLEIEKLRLEDSKKELRRRKNRLYYSALDREQSQKGLLDVQEDLFVLNVTARETWKFKGVLEKGFIATLKEIYPINALRDDPNVYLIRRVWLPHSEFINVDEERVATALGWTAHLVTLLALYMEIPLRYPINPMSSRSMILDRLSLHGPGNMEFPLFIKGQDKLRFEYGVFLLNKNIEQLMAVAGVVVKNLRNTLPNLKALMDAMSKPAIDATRRLPSENDAVLKIPVSYRVIDTPVAAPPLDTSESYTSIYSRPSDPILSLAPFQVEEQQQSLPSNADEDSHSIAPLPLPSEEISPEFNVDGVAPPSDNNRAPPTPSKSQLQKSIQFLNKSLLDAATASLTSSPHSSPVPRSVNVPLVAETQQPIVLSSAKALPVSTTTTVTTGNNNNISNTTAGNSHSAPLPSQFGPESNVEFLKSVDAIRSLPCSSACSPSPTVREDDSDSSVGSDDGSSESSGAESFGSEGLRLNAASESGTVKPIRSTLGLRLKQLVIEVPSATASGDSLINNTQTKRAKKPTIDTTTYSHQTNTISSSLSSTGSALDNFRTPTTEMSPTRGAFWRAVAVNVGATGGDADTERDSVDDAGENGAVAGSPRNSSVPARPSMLGTLGWNSLQQPMSIAGSMFMNPFNLGRGTVTVVEAGGGGGESVAVAAGGVEAGEDSPRRS
ncbi:hypothetical protein HDU81_004125 [Chytriomyces hyalinus]|nr:hypothetical protein HDU81_004125 [Chytriomyces hyalinus]